jgi:hypothetical protein
MVVAVFTRWNLYAARETLLVVSQRIFRKHFMERAFLLFDFGYIAICICHAAKIEIL